MKKVSVIGHFAVGRQYLNGQTIKTKIVAGELERALGVDQVSVVDTHGGRKTLLKAPFQVIHGLKHSGNVVILPAKNGLRVYAPLLAVCKQFFRNRKLHYVVIGGWLPQFLETRKWLAKALMGFDSIYVETNAMKRALEEQGFSNVCVMPNCKDLTVLSESELVFPELEPYKLCTFSRVMQEKGIAEAVDAVKTVNDALGRQVFSLDIYGQVDPQQTDWFADLQKTFPESVRYGGMVPFDKSVEVLKEYFALLFPTRYEGEGFAGTLIDAFSAGVPVIASDWKYNGEIVNDRVGYAYPTGDQTAFVNILMQIAGNPEMILGKKRACLEETQKYRIDQALRILIDQIESE